MSDVTRILQSLEDGNPQAADELLPVVYAELRRMAAAKMANEKPGHTLSATALVHEAWLRLVVGDGNRAPGGRQWDGRGHFFAAAAEAMRRILVENARRKSRQKYGGGWQRAELQEIDVAVDVEPDRLLALDEALEKLAIDDPVAAQIVKLHQFTGVSIDEAATLLGVSPATAYRHWNYGKAFLRCEIADDNIGTNR